MQQVRADTPFPEMPDFALADAAAGVGHSPNPTSLNTSADTRCGARADTPSPDSHVNAAAGMGSTAAVIDTTTTDNLSAAMPTFAEFGANFQTAGREEHISFADDICSDLYASTARQPAAASYAASVTAFGADFKAGSLVEDASSADDLCDDLCGTHRNRLSRQSRPSMRSIVRQSDPGAAEQASQSAELNTHPSSGTVQAASNVDSAQHGLGSEAISLSSSIDVAAVEYHATVGSAEFARAESVTEGASNV